MLFLFVIYISNILKHMIKAEFICYSCQNIDFVRNESLPEDCGIYIIENKN